MAMAPFAADASSSFTPTSLRPNGLCSARATLCSPWRSLRITVSPASSSARFISVLSLSTSQKSVRPNNILALDPDFYKIPYVDGVPVGNRLKIWNLPPDCDHSALLSWLNSIEDVNCVKMEYTDDPELISQGVGGFVEFETKSQACMAIVRLDGRKFGGRCIRMDFVEKKPHERPIGGRRNRPNRNYSRSSMDYGYGDSRVQNFEPSGNFKTNMATAVAGSPSPFATMARPPQQYASPPSHKIYVGNLPWRVDENRLINIFGKYGTVVEAKVMRDIKTGNSRGFGFVEMGSEEEKNNAIAALNHMVVDGRSIKLNPATG